MVGGGEGGACVAVSVCVCVRVCACARVRVSTLTLACVLLRQCGLWCSLGLTQMRQRAAQRRLLPPGCASGCSAVHRGLRRAEQCIVEPLFGHSHPHTRARACPSLHSANRVRDWCRKLHCLNLAGARLRLLVQQLRDLGMPCFKSFQLAALTLTRSLPSPHLWLWLQLRRSLH